MAEVGLNHTAWERLVDWSVGGVDFGVMEEGGLECKLSVGGWRRVGETAVGVGVSAAAFLFGRANLPDEDLKRCCPHPRHYRPARIFLLVWFSLVFGLEIAFKLVNKALIQMFFPCHVVSMCWIYILASPPTRFNVSLYRCVLHYTHGTLLAILFPVDDIRKLPFERENYWLQHYLILLLPLYMVVFERDTYPLPPSRHSANSLVSWPWVFVAYGIWVGYHWVVMHGISVLTLANLGHMLCPAATDPFAGPDYRLIGTVHQFLMTALSGILAGIVRSATGDDEVMEQRPVTHGEKCDQVKEKEKEQEQKIQTGN